MLPAKTVPRLFLDQVARRSDQVALHFKRDGSWVRETWQDVAERVSCTLAVLQWLGVTAGDRVVQVSENRSQWLITDLAIQMAGAVHVPIHAPLTGLQIAFQVADSGARVVLVSDSGQAQKLVAAESALPGNIQVVSYDPCSLEIAGSEILFLEDRKSVV